MSDNSDIPDREPNRDDPVIQPYGYDDRSSSMLHKIARWLRWRSSGDDLPEDLHTIMTIEAAEATALAELTQTLEESPGETLEEKLRDPEQRDLLRTLSLRWMRLQAALIEASTVALDRKSHSNGH